MRRPVHAKALAGWLALVLAAAPAAGSLGADVVVGTKVAVGASGAGGTSGSSELHLAMCHHYRVHHDVVVVVHKRGIPDEHIPVVLFLAERCRATPDAIVALRLKGKSWMEIALSFGHHAEIFHVVVARDHGPPYGKAFGHFKRPRGEWGAIRLADDDVVALVNVRFLSAHHGISADEVIALRQKDDDFVKLHGRVKAARAQGAAGKTEAGPGGASAAARGKEAAAPGKDHQPGPERGGPFSAESGPKGGGGKGGGSGGGRGKGK